MNFNNNNENSQQQRKREKRKQRKSNNLLTGTEPYLVGLSPSYWCYQPMLISEIQNYMELNNDYGVDCLTTTLTTTTTSSSLVVVVDSDSSFDSSIDEDSIDHDDHDNIDSSSSNNNNNVIIKQKQQKQQQPISKCIIVGNIVYKNILNDKTTYVIDDGTDLIDCIQWISISSSSSSSSNNNNNPDYYLPSLFQHQRHRHRTSFFDNNDNNKKTTTPPTTNVLNNNDDDRKQQQQQQQQQKEKEMDCKDDKYHHHHHHGDHGDVDVDVDDHDGHGHVVFQLGDLVCIYGKIKCLAISKNKKNDTTKIRREIIITSIERILTTLDFEAHHWLKCCYQRTTTQCNYKKKKESSSSSSSSSLYYMDLLGPTIRSQIIQKQDLPSADDTLARWRVFGKSCTCCCSSSTTTLQHDDDNNNGIIHKNLLYCHCQATVVKWDPKYIFRDELLKMLLQWQSNEIKKLVFPYSQIRKDVKLIDIATKLLVDDNNNNNNKIYNINRVFTSTFKALRDDGILYLQDERTDSYLLITREKVLEPYVRNSNSYCQNNFNNNKKRKLITTRYNNNNNNYNEQQQQRRLPEFWLSNVHEERLKYIQRCLKQEEQQQQQQKQTG